MLPGLAVLPEALIEPIRMGTAGDIAGSRKPRDRRERAILGRGPTDRGPSPIKALQRGAVTWQVVSAQGALAGAAGLITSNFTVGGEVVDSSPFCSCPSPERSAPGDGSGGA